MDELRGPNIQIVLHVKEGLGFGFLRSPFIVSGSLNGYMLETDPAVPCHAPVFDAELVWEADKRRFRSLRVQNVPIKVEVYTTGTQGRKDKVGYLLLSLLGAQPCPSNKIVEIKHTWHRLLGVKTEGKCCHPQLLMSLSVEDRVSALTPRNELRMFHSNEVAYPSTYVDTNPPTARSLQMTVQEYMAESKKTVSSPALRPQLLVDEGLIQLGSGRQLFVLSLAIGSMENLDQFLPNNEPVECYITYSIFTHNVMTDRVPYAPRSSGSHSLHFNQRTSLRLRGSLPDLTRYLAECPHLVARLCAGERDVAICSLDLRKLVPTEDIEQFVGAFCDSEGAVRIHERAFPLRCAEPGGPPPAGPGRRPYLDFEMTFRFLGEQKEVQKPNILTARSVTQLESERRPSQLEEIALDCKSGSCTQLDGDLGGVAYTNIGGCNTDRYKTASGDAVLKTGELTDLIKKMYETFTISQEALTRRIRTSDANVQCDDADGGKGSGDGQREKQQEREKPQESGDGEPKLDSSKSDTCINASKNFMDMPKHADLVALALSSMDRSTIMQRFVDELEDWKERQQQLYNAQLKRKEEYHLEQLSLEWSRRRDELERRLAAGLERCRLLANDLRNATDDFRLRGYRNTEREKKLLDAKKALESHYTAKYQELREASQKMEADSEHQLRLKDMRIEEMEAKIAQLEKQVHELKNNIKDTEKEAENKYSGLTKDQTASLIQELRCLEEKLSHAQQSKAFFKEQWGRAVRELHLAKLAARRHALTSLRVQRRQLGDLGPGSEEEPPCQPKLKDDYYDVFAHDPLHARSMISSGNLDGIDVYEDLKLNLKNPASDKLSELISQRDALIQQDSPDEGALRSLNHEIRSMLLNCAT